jgi:hypothetical protein
MYIQHPVGYTDTKERQTRHFDDIVNYSKKEKSPNLFGVSE